MALGTILVTGASSGLGAAIARRFADAGARVFGTSRSTGQSVAGVEMIELDLRSPESIRTCILAVTEKSGRIDLLVNNAGVMHMGTAEETPPAIAREIMETNFFGTVALTNAVLPQMRARRRGRIINIGSLSAWIGEPGEAYYSASKRALGGYTEALRQEVLGLGIWVSLVEPGAFRTEILHNVVETPAMIADYDDVRAAIARTMAKGLAAGADPGKVGELVLKVARQRRPRLRYGVGLDARVLPYLKLLLPQAAFEYLMRKGYGLERAPRQAD